MLPNVFIDQISHELIQMTYSHPKTGYCLIYRLVYFNCKKAGSKKKAQTEKNKTFLICFI